MVVGWVLVGWVVVVGDVVSGARCSGGGWGVVGGLGGDGRVWFVGASGMDVIIRY